MFEVESSILLVTTASAQNNNLAIEGLKKIGCISSVAVIHAGWINMIPVSKAYEVRDKYIPIVPAGTRPRKVTSTVTQVMWIDLGDETLFVTTSSLGLHIFDSEGRILVYSHPCNTKEKEKSMGKFARGLATMGNTLFVGDSDGTLRVFEIYEDREGVDMLQEQKGHPSAITDLATMTKDDFLVISGDDSGFIVLWSYSQKLQRVLTIEGYSSPCNSIHLWEGAIICGYGSGHIRFFDSKDGRIRTEIGAHARSITALDVSQEQGLLLSVSEDSFAKMWKMNKRGFQIEPIASECIRDSMLVGAKFMNSSGTKFCVSTFDRAEVLCLSTVQKPKSD